MKASQVRACILVCLIAFPASAQTDADRGYREASGPISMCGLEAEDVGALRDEVLSSSSFTPANFESPRFEGWRDDANTRHITFTKVAEAAYPAVTCRTLFERDGALMIGREMRCEAAKEECSALFDEFTQLDAELTRHIRGGQ